MPSVFVAYPYSISKADYRDAYQAVSRPEAHARDARPAAGVHPKVVSERLGHASVVITLDTYSPAIPALQETAAELVASLVFSD
jgi:integrase